MSLGESIRSGTKWLLAGRASSQIFQFLIGIVLARILVPADFGMLVTIQIFTGVAGLVAGGGMGQALVQAKTVHSNDRSVVFTMQLLICLLIYSFFYSIAPFFPGWFNNPLYTDLLRVSALGFILRPFIMLPNSILQREMRFRAKASITFAAVTVTGIASITMAWHGLGVWSLILGGLAGNVVNIVLLFFVTRWSPRIGFDREVASRLGSYGIRLTTNDLLIYLKSQTSNLILSRMLGPAMVGLYNKADSLNQMPRRLILHSIYQTVFRAHAQIQDNLDLSKYLYFKNISLVNVYAMPFYVAMWWLAEPFIIAVYGEKWSAAVAPLEIMALSGLVLFASPSGAVIAAHNRLGREIFVNIETWALLIAGTLIGISWGLSGVAWSLVINRFYGSFRLFMIARKCIDGKWADLWQASLPGLILNTILFFILLLVDTILPQDMRVDSRWLYLLAMSTAGITTYAVALLFLPIKDIAAEAERWKKLLRFPHTRMQAEGGDSDGSTGSVPKT